MSETRGPLVEVLYFDGCPNRPRAQALVERISAEIGVGVGVNLVNVLDPDTAARERFLGSPSIRVDGRDIEPGAEARRATKASASFERLCECLGREVERRLRIIGSRARKIRIERACVR